MIYGEALLFGAALAIAVGPIALLIMRAALNYGFRGSLPAAWGAALADFTYALPAFGAGFGVVTLLERWRSQIELASSSLLIVLGLWLLGGSLQAGKASAAAAPPRLAAVYLLTLANPLTVLLFLGFAGRVQPGAGLLQIPLLAGAVFVGSLAVQLLFAATGAGIGKAVTNPRIISALNILSATGITAFGIRGILD